MTKQEYLNLKPGDLVSFRLGRFYEIGIFECFNPDGTATIQYYSATGQEYEIRVCPELLDIAEKEGAPC